MQWQDIIAMAQDVKGGEKMYRAGGPIAWFGCRRSGKMSG